MNSSSETLVASEPSQTHTKEKVAKPTTTTNTSQVRWAPIRGIPIERRLQMLAVCTWISMMFMLVSLFFFMATYKFLWPILIAYISFLYVDKAPENGGRRFERARHWTLWKYFAAYFPAQLIKEHDLDPKHNYVFGYHPHGIISYGAQLAFATEATGFSEKFPGITPSLLTLNSNFRIPFYRDVIMALGIASVSRTSCENILSSGPGRSIAIVVGGAAESLNARPGTADLVLRKRLGFIRLAIKHGASLVPVFSFGENEVYDQLDNAKGSKVFMYQKKMQAMLGFTMPLFHARGIFNYDVGIIPFRHQITTVVGKPIPVPALEEGQTDPTQEQILAVQQLYIDELFSIYNKYKDVYAKDRKKELCITD